LPHRYASQISVISPDPILALSGSREVSTVEAEQAVWADDIGIASTAQSTPIPTRRQIRVEQRLKIGLCH
jgi:hypothetical protein